MRKCLFVWIAAFSTGLSCVVVAPSSKAEAGPPEKKARATPAADALVVHVIAKKWMWKILHADGQREINELHLPVGRPVRLKLISEDVPHGFSVPALHVKVDVPPGRYVSASFTPNKVGRYRLECSRDCGEGCKRMVGTVIVMEPAAYLDWLTYRAEGSLASQGRKVFLKLKCVNCHRPDGRGPVLANLYGSRVKLADGRTVVVDENYLRESILKPRAKVVQGWKPVMPSFKGKVSEEEIGQLIAFIKAEKLGRKAVPAEEYPPPRTTPPVREKQKPVAPAARG